MFLFPLTGFSKQPIRDLSDLTPEELKRVWCQISLDRLNPDTEFLATGTWKYVVQQSNFEMSLQVEFNQSDRSVELIDFHLKYAPNFYGFGGLRTSLGRKSLELGMNDVDLFSNDQLVVESFFDHPLTQSNYFAITVKKHGLLPGESDRNYLRRRDQFPFDVIFIPLYPKAPMFINPRLPKSRFVHHLISFPFTVSLFVDPRMRTKGTWTPIDLEDPSEELQKNYVFPSEEYAQKLLESLMSL